MKFLNLQIHLNDIDDEYVNAYPHEPMRLSFYGYEPRIPSYRLRVCFLHLLLHMYGTPAEEELSDSLLIMCLIDMLQGYDFVRLDHPLTMDFIHAP